MSLSCAWEFSIANLLILIGNVQKITKQTSIEIFMHARNFQTITRFATWLRFTTCVIFSVYQPTVLLIERWNSIYLWDFCRILNSKPCISTYWASMWGHFKIMVITKALGIAKKVVKIRKKSTEKQLQKQCLSNNENKWSKIIPSENCGSNSLFPSFVSSLDYIFLTLNIFNFRTKHFQFVPAVSYIHWRMMTQILELVLTVTTHIIFIFMSNSLSCVKSSWQIYIIYMKKKRRSINKSELEKCI